MVLDFGTLIYGEPVEKIGPLCQLLDRGFTHLWMGDVVGGMPFDQVVTMTIAALHTKRVKIGTSVTGPYVRHPLINANAMATLDVLSGGRAILGLGGGAPWVKTMAVPVAPIKVLEDTVHLTRQLWQGETVTYDSPYMKLVNASLKYKVAHRIPIYVFPSGPNTLRMAGRVADGAVMYLGRDPAGVKKAIGYIAEGATEAGRDTNQIYKVCWSFFSMREDRTQARNDCKPMVAVMFSTQHAKEVAEFTGVDPKVAQKIRASTNEATWGRADAEGVKYVTDEMVDNICICGTPDDVIQKLRTVETVGFNQAALIPARISSAEKPKMMEALIDHVIPKLR